MSLGSQIDDELCNHGGRRTPGWGNPPGKAVAPPRGPDDDLIDLDWIIDSLGLGSQPDHTGQLPHASSSGQLSDHQAVIETELAAEPMRVDASDGGERCWGAEASGDSCCVRGFKPGKAHLKNKFCPNCINGFDLPLARVRALTPSVLAFISNTNSR